MKELEKQNLDIEEAKQGLLQIVRENRYATLGAGLLASVGTVLAGHIGAAVGGGVGGLFGNLLDQYDSYIRENPETDSANRTSDDKEVM